MNRSDTVRNILVLEQFAAEAKRLAGQHRDRLGAEARAELEQHGTAPTWRLPDIAQVVLPVSKQAVLVSDAALLQAWVQHHTPDEIEVVTTRRVRPGYVNALLGEVIADGEAVVWRQTGEVVPGLAVRAGGVPGSLSIKADPGVKAVVADQVAAMLGTAHSAITAVPDAGPVAVAGPWSATGDLFELFPGDVRTGGGSDV